MRVFVAGASGAIGIRLVPHLFDHGHEVIGTATTPATSDGNRNHSADTTPTRVANHDNTKNNGGVISASECTVDTTPHNPPDDTIQYVDNSSANTD